MSSHVFAKIPEGAYQLGIEVLVYVLDRLARGRIVHQLEKVLFEISLGLLPKLGVHEDVRS